MERLGEEKPPDRALFKKEPVLGRISPGVRSFWLKKASLKSTQNCILCQRKQVGTGSIPGTNPVGMTSSTGVSGDKEPGSGAEKGPESGAHKTGSTPIFGLQRLFYTRRLSKKELI